MFFVHYFKQQIIIFAVMIDIICYILCFLLCAVGAVGCFVPVIPGPPLSFAGYLLLLLTPANEAIPLVTVIVLGTLTLLSVIFDYVIPSLGVKWFGGTKYGKLGSLAGTLAGLLFMPWGLIAGPFAGAFIGELCGKSNTTDALKSGVGSLVGFLCGTLFKLFVTFAIIFYAIRAVLF